MPPLFDLDRVLTTTRTVRRRLDLTRPVDRTTIEECLDLALQAPNGKNEQNWGWVVIDDPDRRARVADLYRAAIDEYRTAPDRDHWAPSTDADRRVTTSVMHLREHMHEVPVLIVPVLAGRVEGLGVVDQANHWGSIFPAMWSLMLALRSRGLGSAWTTLSLGREHEMADLLGIPHEHHTQAGLLAVGHTMGTDFKPAPRRPAAEVIRWNRW